MTWKLPPVNAEDAAAYAIRSAIVDEKAGRQAITEMDSE
jgi:hypothetical protein